MKNKYQMSVPLVCKSCQSEDIYLSEDKRFARCNQCQKEYPGGYDELVRANKLRIDAEMKKMQAKVVKDAEKKVDDMLKKAFGGGKNFRF
ncbi:hypothetical protein SAMN05216327_101243 [Dyadobacter sp. SG02]|uniref:hypothetical protein n=1 Tax=Dyadobacter sp. SG02 TaxID=1855291 RepID=UPI0008D818EA|nr:hypothetical protein [Dyadobacter sp. SG02]SEI39987.1 hypothetical protein SAMN05216327_101243 [Dyadobacter sp. SG02]